MAPCLTKATGNKSAKAPETPVGKKPTSLSKAKAEPTPQQKSRVRHSFLNIKRKTGGSEFHRLIDKANHPRDLSPDYVDPEFAHAAEELVSSAGERIKAVPQLIKAAVKGRTGIPNAEATTDDLRKVRDDLIIAEASDKASQEGFGKGFEKGHTLGREQGHEDGFDFGAGVGHAVGFNEGHEIGHDEGTVDGMATLDALDQWCKTVESEQ